MTADESGARGAQDARGLGALTHQSAREVVLAMGDQEAHDVHHALSMAIQLIDYAMAEPGGIPSQAPLQPDARERLVRVARRLDHERRHKGAVANPHAHA